MGKLAQGGGELPEETGQKTEEDASARHVGFVCLAAVVEDAVGNIFAPNMPGADLKFFVAFASPVVLEGVLVEGEEGFEELKLKGMGEGEEGKGSQEEGALANLRHG